MNRFGTLGFRFHVAASFRNRRFKSYFQRPRTALETPDSSPYKVKKNDRKREAA